MLSLYGTLFTMPSASTTLNQMGDWSSTLFTEFWPLITVILGVGVAFLVIKLIVGLFNR